MALIFYIEPILTDDLDIFCYIPQDTESILVNLSSIYSYLTKLGYESERECIVIEGVAVQFLVPNSDLVVEALENSQVIEIEGVITRVFGYEYLLAIMAQTGRPKDKAKIAQALESREPDAVKLKDILKRYNLDSIWGAIAQ